MVYDGYGALAEYVALGLRSLGLNVSAIPTAIDRTGLSPALLEMVDSKSKKMAGALKLIFGPPTAELMRTGSHSHLAINTMWESSLLPTGWASLLNNADLVVVPTPYVADVFGRSGVTAPICVIPEGIDPQVYPFVDRSDRATFTTLVVGMLNERKHGHAAIAAWQLAFQNDPNARLIFKSRWQVQGSLPNDPRIHFVDSNRATRGILDYYQTADVLLALGNEGFGMPLVEGMATGLPVIALDSEGQSDTCRAAGPERLIAVHPAGWQVADDTIYGYAGMRGIPDVSQVAKWLQWVSGHRDESRQMGQQASLWVHEHRNVWTKSERLADEFAARFSGLPRGADQAQIGRSRRRISRAALFGRGHSDQTAISGQHYPSSTSALGFVGTSDSAARRDVFNGQKRIFISWSGSRGLAIARELKDVLDDRIGNDVEVFVSKPGILPGSNPYKVMLDENLLRADALLAVVTERSVGSAWLVWESASVWARGGLVVPVFVDVRPDDIPGPLTQLCQGGDLLDSEFLDGAVASIIGRVGRGSMVPVTGQEMDALRRLTSQTFEDERND
jgi:hypothetical protein